VGLGDAQIGQQESHRLGRHRRAPVGMNDQLVRCNGLLAAGFRDQALSQGCRFAAGKHPADHITAENVQDDIQVVVTPLDRPQEFGDVP